MAVSAALLGLGAVPATAQPTVPAAPTTVPAHICVEGGGKVMGSPQGLAYCFGGRYNGEIISGP
ncbi:hypothetical protein C7M71_029530 [Peterkaempfera bronchialis]|uniref:Uncharacterized protein n=2 Tax=Peterkaempfera bronchialis TaxID=2126346 RepID=A0A345T4K2_9ACTN|nr:hypothetical protein C7M71_029530 [Peterkaempfera bronchialis]